MTEKLEEFKLNKIYQGDCLEVLKTFPDESIDCVVTSPPYWAVRDYGEQNEIIWDGDEKCNHEFETTERKIHSGTSSKNINPAIDNEGGFKTDWKQTDKYCKKCGSWKGQLGLEEHPQQYINHIVQIIKECKRVLKSTGTIWLNLGDSFYTKSGSGQGNNYLKRHEEMDAGRGELHKAHTETRGKFKSNWLQSKQRLLIPYRIAIACQDELGLILRNDITWIKQIINWKTKESFGSSMPTSVQDRLNTNSEAIFLFVKSPDYFFNLDAIRVKHKDVSIKRNEYPRLADTSKEGVSFGRAINPGEFLNPKGKNGGDCIIFPMEEESELQNNYKYKLNHNFFKDINTESKSYWFGFIFADGNVDKKTNRMTVGLSIKDKEHIIKLKEDILSENVIEYETINGHETCFLRWYSEDMKKDLLDKEIKKVNAFNFISEELLPHFIRGLIDGDGWIRYRLASNKRNTDFEVGFCNTDKEVVKKVFFVLKSICGSKSEYIRKYKGTYSFSIGGKEQVYNIGRWLYKDAQIYLKRKKMSFPNFINETNDCIMFPLEPSSENHYAMFPKTLPEFCIKAGCPKEVCNKCGKPKQVTQVTHNRVNDREDNKVRLDNVERVPQDWKPKEVIETKEISCNCNVGFSPGLVLDPFSGGGTTLFVAKHLLRNYIGIEINPTYIKEIQNSKLAQEVLA